MYCFIHPVFIYIGGGVQEHDETDELLLMDEEVLLMDPDHLPRQLLSDFAVYNSEVKPCHVLR